MNTIFSLFHEILYRPLLNGLIWIYTILPWQDMGLAIIILTVVIRLILLPFLWRGQQAQKKMAALQPEIKKLQEKFKNDRETQGKALMELYKKHNVNPFSGCLVLLIQIPILIALFQVFQKGFNLSELQFLYSFVPRPEILNPISFGLLDLSKGNIYLGVIAAITQYYQTKVLMPSTPPAPKGAKPDFATIFQKQSLYLFPIFILVWSYTLPSALTLYWTVLNIFGIVQEIIVRKSANKTLEVQ